VERAAVQAADRWGWGGYDHERYPDEHEYRFFERSTTVERDLKNRDIFFDSVLL
jgi:hypothetical protein